MKLDATALRYLTRDDFRVLSALEVGSRNHECIPMALLSSISRMRPGALHGRLGELAKHKLVSRENGGRGVREEGYRLTYGGYDYLALHALASRGSVSGVGRQIGVGKESDVYLVTGDFLAESGLSGTPRAHDFVLKLQRLGRTSFRTVKTNRDYLGGRRSASWMYLSRLAAEREWAFLVALNARGFPTPVPVDHSRHCVVMSWVPGAPLDSLGPHSFGPDGDAMRAASVLYAHLVSLVLRLASVGLVHGDFNEFNVLVLSDFVERPAEYSADGGPCPIVLIDFPQMVSVRHPNADEQFARDVSCLRVFFMRRFGFEAAEWPEWERDVSPLLASGGGLMDADLRASGFRGYTGARRSGVQCDTDADLDGRSTDAGSDAESSSDGESAGFGSDGESADLESDASHADIGSDGPCSDDQSGSEFASAGDCEDDPDLQR